MIEADTVKLLRECDAGVKMGVASIDDTLGYVHNPEHEKAWFIRVTINACKDLLKSFFRKHTVSLDQVLDQPAPLEDRHREVLEAVLSLPPNYKDVVYLHYYEGYTAPEIGHILGKNVNTIYTLLGRARRLLKETLGGEASE